MSGGHGALLRYRKRVVEGPILRTMLWLGIPPLISALVSVSYNLVDALWLSRLGSVTIAVPRQVRPSLMFFYSVGMSFSAANLAIVSQLVGSGDAKRASRVVAQLYTAALLLGTGLMLLYLAARPLLFATVMAVPPRLYGDVMLYSGIVALGIPLGTLSFAFTTVLNAIGDTRTPTVLNIASATMNMVLDPIMIFGLLGFPALGVAGAAIATVLSRALVASFAVLSMIRGFRGVRAGVTLRFERWWISRSLYVGLPIMASRMTNSFAFMLQNRLVNTFGAEAAAAYAIGFAVMDLVDGMLWGFIGAISIMIGQALGAGLIERARRVAKTAMALLGGLMAVGTAILYLVYPYFVALFTSEPRIFALAAQFIELFAVTLPFFGLYFVAQAVGRGSGHTLIPTAIAFTRLWGVRLGIGYLLAFVAGLGIFGVWLSMAIGNVVGGLLGVAWVLLGRWARPIVARRGPRMSAPVVEG